MRRLFLKLVVGLSIIAFVGCTKKEKNEIPIGVTGPFSGGSAPIGLSFRNGVQMAIDEINAAGGILGKKVVAVVRDDEAKNEKGTQIAQEFLDKEGVVAIIGPSNTGVADASTKYANQKKVPQFISVSSGAKVNEHFAEFPENYIFRFAVSDEIQSLIIAKEAINTRKFKKPAIICDDTNFGQAGRERLEKHLEKMAVKPVYIGKFKLKDTDMTAQLQQAKAGGADVILTYGIGAELAAMSNTMEKIGWKVPMVSAWTMSMGSYLSNAKQNGEGNSMPMSFIEAGDHPERVKKFLNDYHTKFNENPIASALAAVQSYDSVYLLKQAIEQAQSTEGPKIRAALENLEKPFEGLSGKFVKPYSATDHEAMREDHIQIGVVKGGMVIPRTN